MVAPQLVGVSLACVSLLLAACSCLVLLWFAPTGSWGPPAVSWTRSSSRSAPSTCPLAWQTASENDDTTRGSYRQCLARHGKNLHSGYSLRCVCGQATLNFDAMPSRVHEDTGTYLQLTPC